MVRLRQLIGFEVRITDNTRDSIVRRMDNAIDHFLTETRHMLNFQGLIVSFRDNPDGHTFNHPDGTRRTIGVTGDCILNRQVYANYLARAYFYQVDDMTMNDAGERAIHTLDDSLEVLRLFKVAIPLLGKVIIKH
jgi:hypothetical protein